MFDGICSSLLIGSFPLDDHLKAIDLIFKYTPEIPVWPQLPRIKEENMILQFLPGMPGFRYDMILNREELDKEILDFYQEYLDIKDGKRLLIDSRFALKDEAKGFEIFRNVIKKLKDNDKKLLRALKGQITGPFTFCASVKDDKKRLILYDDQLKDVAVKLIALKARYETEVLAQFSLPVIIFFDEPGLAGFGSSEFISVSRIDVVDMLKEVFLEVREAGGIAGIHVCANTDWSLVVEADPDIINFDAYGYFEKFMLFSSSIKNFLEKGGMIAWGIVPTFEHSEIEKEDVDSLFQRFESGIRRVEKETEIPYQKVLEQSLITPSCGLGSLNYEDMIRVLELLNGVTKKIKREMYG